jgi:23S rRNA (guanine745-N1)-methyltransferase
LPAPANDRPLTPEPLRALAARLRCPNCGRPLAAGDRSLACEAGHTFDVARQGHVSLLPPGGRRARGDSGAMVAARAAFLGAGHFGPIADAVAAVAAGALRDEAGREPVIGDAGAGTGHYLAAALRGVAGARGIALDASAPALRQAARAHPRIAAVACDVWQGLPLRDAAADLVLNVFAPRHGTELARVLAPGGALVVVTPGPGHLAELVGALGLLGVDPDKDARLHARLAPAFASRARPHRRVRDGARTRGRPRPGRDGPERPPSRPRALHGRVGRLAEPVRVTASVTVETFAAVRPAR